MIAEASANAWHGFWGVLLGLLTVALVAWLVAKLAGVEIELPVSDAMLGAVVAGIILLFALIKVLVDDFTAAAAYVGLVLAAIVAVGAWLNVQEAGGVDSLRSEASGMKDAATSGAGTAAATPEPAPEPSPPTPAPDPSSPARTRSDSPSPRTVARAASSPGSRSGRTGAAGAAAAGRSGRADELARRRPARAAFSIPGERRRRRERRSPSRARWSRSPCRRRPATPRAARRSCPSCEPRPCGRRCSTRSRS